MQAAASARFAPQPGALAAALALSAGLSALVSVHGDRMLALFAIGLALGATLLLASFGFASAYRRMLEGRGTRGVRAQLIMLGAASLLFAPILAEGQWFGTPVAGALAPAGLQVLAGAFTFGIGMQLAGACGSGTLYAAGAGQARLALALAGFCAGSFWATLHMGGWERLPGLGPVSLGDALGWPVAVALQLAAFAVLYAVLARLPGADADAPPPRGASPASSAMWPLAAGALGLALLNLLTLVVAGHPWSITWAFSLWGAKAARLLGWSPLGDAFWSGDFQRAALESSVFADDTSVMDLGILLGAFVAAGASGGFRPRAGGSPRMALAAALGGLAMGYGARIAYGCNIGAFFSGVASTSLHGWLWIAAALPGCWVGLRLHGRLVR